MTADPLDALLAAHRVPPPGAALVGRILAAAPARRRSRARGWWAALGLGATGLAGALTGAAALAAAAPALLDLPDDATGAFAAAAPDEASL